MTYLIDSNVFRDLMDEHPKAAQRLAAAIATQSVAVSVIVRGEVLFGIERLPAGRRRDTLSLKADRLFSALAEEPVPYMAAVHYSRIKRGRERTGSPMDENDLWIAATALALGATLVTRDADFRNTPGLVVEDWTS